jgi:hypothetical protein
MNVRALIMAGCLLTFGLASCGPKTETPATTDSTAAQKDTVTTPTVDTTAKPTVGDTATSPVLDSAMNKKDTATLLTDSAIHSSTKKPEAKKPATSSKSTSTKESSNNNTVGTSTSPTSAEGRRTGTGTGETPSGRRR